MFSQFHVTNSAQHCVFEVTTAVLLEIQVFWDVTECRLGNYRRFGEA